MSVCKPFTDDINVANEMLKVQRSEYFTVTPLCILLTILNLFYLVTRIRKLEHKSYHAMMFSVLQITYVMLPIS